MNGRLLPTEVKATAATGVVRALCPEADELTTCRYDEVTFIDQGGNFESVCCPACKTVLDTRAWWQQQMEAAYSTRFQVLSTVTPCCSSTVSLNDLEYSWPAGFARFEVRVSNPGRGWLSQEEMAQVSAALGITVRQIMAHY